MLPRRASAVAGRARCGFAAYFSGAHDGVGQESGPQVICGDGAMPASSSRFFSR